MSDDTQEMNIPLCTVFEQMHNLSGSTSNTCMGSSVGMVTNAKQNIILIGNSYSSDSAERMNE
jgi:hypothetical protein